MELTCLKRDQSGKSLDKLRKDGYIPAISYGKNEESKNISIERKAFEKIFSEVGTTSVVEGGGELKGKDFIISDVQYDSVKGNPIHVDLRIVEKGTKVTVDIPINFVNVAPVEKKGGIVSYAINSIEVKGEATKLPQSIEIDTSVLENVNDVILVKSIKLPDGIECLVDGDLVVASAIEVKEEEEKEDGADFSVESIEVDKKGKKEEDGDNNKEEEK